MDNFPEVKYLERLVNAQAQKVAGTSGLQELLVMYSGARLNWLAEVFTDTNVNWSKQTLKIDALTFTGTTPEWNKILIEKCLKSPHKLRAELLSNPKIVAIFAEAKFTTDPILVRVEDDKYKVLDGTHRLIGAILENKIEIDAYVARVSGNPKPACEPHVVYDLIRAYLRGMNRDRTSLVTSLKFLRKAYNNVEGLLQNRFNNDWISNKEMQDIIAEALSN